MRNFTGFLVAMAVVIGFANVSQANEYTHEAYISPDGNEESYHGKETRPSIGRNIGRAVGQLSTLFKSEDLSEGFKEGRSGETGAEYDYHREGGVSYAKYRNYPDDPQGTLPSGRYAGYPPINSSRGCSPAIIVPGSNIVLPVPGTTRSGRAFYAPNSGLQTNIGSNGWNVRLGN